MSTIIIGLFLFAMAVCAQEIISASHRHRVLLCLDHHEISQVRKLLEEQHVATRIVHEDDVLTEGVSILEKKMVEGFSCLTE